MARQPAHGVSLHRVYGEGNFLHAMAGAALESPLLKAARTGRDLSQPHLVLTDRTGRPLCNTHHRTIKAASGEPNPDPDTDRNDRVSVPRSVNPLMTITGNLRG